MKIKFNSVQEACPKCFAVHILKFEILPTTWKKQNKKHQNARSIDEKLQTKSLMFFVSFFYVICKISNFNMWTAKHLVQASCTELTLRQIWNLNLESTLMFVQWMKKIDIVLLICSYKRNSFLSHYICVSIYKGVR